MEMNAVNSIRLYDAFYKTDRSAGLENTEQKKTNKSNKDSVAFSDTAKFYKTASSALAKSPDVRDEKVSKIKAMIESGSYNVSSAQIADKLLSV